MASLPKLQLRSSSLSLRQYSCFSQIKPKGHPKKSLLSRSATVLDKPYFKQTRSTSLSSEPFYGSARPETASLFSSLNPLQRITVALNSATSVLADPERADSLAALGEVTGHVALMGIYDKMMKDETGQRILRDRPIVNSSTVDIDAMFKSASEKESDDDKNGLTFGEAYARDMRKNGFSPDERDEVKFISDPELAYVMLRYRQCHDFWHTLCDLPPTVLGELAVKWLELIQTGLPVAALSVTVGPLRLTAEERHILRTKYLPWAVRVGKEATFLMNVYYEEELEEDLNTLRQRLGIEPAPK